MINNHLLFLLKSLEVELHQPEIRKNSDRLTALLHEEFIEFGRSGQAYTKPEIMHHLTLESSSHSIWAQEFTVSVLSPGVALLTYKSARVEKDKTFTRHTLRSSLWTKSAEQWQLRFHQATATTAFDQKDDPWQHLDKLITENRKLEFIRQYRDFAKCTMNKANEALGERYEFLRKTTPHDFNCTHDEYWKGFYS
ncbi:hypothetical protein BTA51_02250 [Hahella sp. CCB-MM4]|uniref:nuclear transport factor 2 family protein n=1 Tax=Hahella sp. (strain CCB-MM4) TaxID=1926491 RepID=UPI000B9BB6D8|nr:nuclear transport factor 2 family protein [Hahella sp. CCB-MM4]OZG75226.1 hypothetical protein BTA51_02250 [Hahella sp. CCB-MM4]